MSITKNESTRYSINPEFDAQLKEQWDKIGLSKESQEALLQFMDAAVLNMLNKECRRIARCLVDEGLSPEKIKSITGCSIEDLYADPTHKCNTLKFSLCPNL